NYNDTEIGITTIKLLNALGYEVILPEHAESGRTYLSKGFVKEAMKLANRNVRALSSLITEETPLIGIEPSAILTLRDEYLTLTDKTLRADAQRLARHSFLIDEFIVQEMMN